MGNFISCSSNLNGIISEQELHDVLAQMETRLLNALIACIQKEISKTSPSTSNTSTETDDDKTANKP